MQPFVFIHIPKTAGSTVRAMLRAAWPGAVRDPGNVFRDETRPLTRLPKVAAAGSGVRAIIGHTPYGLVRAYVPDAQYATVLRDPVTRALSHYHWLITAADPVDDRKFVTREGPRMLPVPTSDMRIEEILERGDYVLDNVATRMLSDAASPFGDVGPAQLEQAKRNLDRFAFVGLTEHFDESIVLLQRTIGLEQVGYESGKVNPARPGPDDIPASQRQAIEDHNQLDLELYGHARTLFERRLATADPGELATAVAQLKAISDTGEPTPAPARTAKPPKRTKPPKSRRAPRAPKPTLVAEKPERPAKRGPEPEEVHRTRLELLLRAEQLTPLLAVDLGEHGRYALSTRDRHVTTSLLLKSARGEMRTLQRAIGALEVIGGGAAVAGRTLVDVGANIGTTTVSALLKHGFADAVACEPEPRNARLLGLNVVANDLEGRVHICAAAVGEELGSLQFVVADRRSGSHEVFVSSRTSSKGVGPNRRVIEVPQVTLDELVRTNVINPERVALLWMDAQGSEGQILSGATALVEHGVPIVTELDPAALARHGGLESVFDIASSCYTHFVPLRRARGSDDIRFDLEPIGDLHTEVEALIANSRFTDVMFVRDPARRPKRGGAPAAAVRVKDTEKSPAAPAAPLPAQIEDTIQERKAFLRDARRVVWTIAAELDSATFLVRTGRDSPESPIFVRRSHPEHRLLAAALGQLEQLGLADDARARGFLDVNAGVGLVTVAAVRWHRFRTAVALEEDGGRHRVLKLAVAMNELDDRVRVLRGSAVALDEARGEGDADTQPGLVWLLNTPASEAAAGAAALFAGAPPVVMRADPRVTELLPGAYTRYARLDSSTARLAKARPIDELPAFLSLDETTADGTVILVVA